MYTILERKNVPRIAEELPKVIFNVLADNDTDKSAFITDYPNAAPGTSIVVLSDEGVETKYVKQNDSDYVELVGSGSGGGGGGVEIFNSTYDSQTNILSVEETMSELIELFNSGKNILITIPEGIPSWVYPGTYLVLGISEYDGLYNLLTLASGNSGLNFNCENLSDYPQIWLGD